MGGGGHHYGTSLSASSSCASDTGSWGKHFYMGYDVSPLGLDELSAYFQTDHCEELICERFMIKDLNVHAAGAGAGTGAGGAEGATSANASTLSEQQGEAPPADDDAGHHSGR